MRYIVLAAISLALAMPAYAQLGGGGKKGKPGEKTAEETAYEKKLDEQQEKAAKKALSRVPDREQKVDPWGNVR